MIREDLKARHSIADRQRWKQDSTGKVGGTIRSTPHEGGGLKMSQDSIKLAKFCIETPHPQIKLCRMLSFRTVRVDSY